MAFRAASIIEDGEPRRLSGFAIGPGRSRAAKPSVWFALLAALGLMFPVRALATSLNEVSVHDLVGHSDRVVLGRVVDVDVVPSGPAGQPGIHTRVLVEVSETLLGRDEALLEVWVQGGELDGRRRVLTGQARFVAGEEVALFLFEAGGGLWPTAMSLGKWVLEGHSVMPPSAPVHPPRGVTALLSEAQPAAMLPVLSIDELRQLVASRGAAR